jgi:O-antigen ligase
MPALTLLAGAVVGQGVGLWADIETKDSKFKIENCFGISLVLLLALASLWNADSGHVLKYRSHVRWSGLWDNPNIAGLLMGTGVALAAGLGMRGWRMEDSGWRKRIILISCLVAAGLMARGLLHSYSRGAWLAMGCGVTYLFWSTVCSPRSTVSPRSRGSCVSWLNKNWLSLSAILISVVVLSFWHFRQTEWHPAHRAFSAGNQNDFSWRNRLSAWEAALQITAEHPWFGAGWNQSEPMYEHYYLPSKSTERGAIETNDYLILGATLGIPALFCFGMYLWLSLFRNSAFSLQTSELLPATCRAGAIVLLVGFWFDGGLFKLVTASTFWILLELGRADLVPQKVTEERKANPILA